MSHTMSVGAQLEDRKFAEEIDEAIAHLGWKTNRDKFIDLINNRIEQLVDRKIEEHLDRYNHYHLER